MAQFSVIPLRRCSLSVLPSTYRPARHRPEHAAAEPVVLLGILTGRKRTDETFVQRHAAEATTSGRAHSRQPAREVALACQTLGEREIERSPRERLRRPHRFRRSGGDLRGQLVRARPELGARHHLVDETARERVRGRDPIAQQDRRQRRARARDARQGLRRAARRDHAHARLGECHHAVVGREAIVALEGELEAEPDRVAVHRREHRHLDRPQQTPHVSAPTRVAHGPDRGRGPELLEVGAGREVITGGSEQHDPHTGIGDHAGEHLAERVSGRDVVDVDRRVIEHDLGGSPACETRNRSAMARLHAEEVPHRAFERHAFACADRDRRATRRPRPVPPANPRSDRRPTRVRASAGRSAPPNRRDTRRRSRIRADPRARTRRDGRRGAADRRVRCSRARAVWCHRRGAAMPPAASRIVRVTTGRRGRARAPPSPRISSSRNGNGSGRPGWVTRTTCAPSSASTRPVSGAAHVEPSTTTRAPSRCVAPTGQRTGGAAAGARRTATAGSIQAPASASTASAESCREVAAQRSHHRVEVGPGRGWARVHPAVGGAQQQRRREQPDREPSRAGRSSGRPSASHSSLAARGARPHTPGSRLTTALIRPRTPARASRRRRRCLRRGRASSRAAGSGRTRAGARRPS